MREREREFHYSYRIVTVTSTLTWVVTKCCSDIQKGGKVLVLYLVLLKHNVS